MLTGPYKAKLLIAIFFVFSVPFIAEASGREKKPPVSTSLVRSFSLLSGKDCVADFPSKYGWPANPVRLWQISGGVKTATLDIPGAVDMAGQREHGWNLFAGITQPAFLRPDSPPVFHTWYTVEEAFDLNPGKRGCAERAPSIQLTLPTQQIMTLNESTRSRIEAAGINVLPRFDVASDQLQLSETAVSPHEGVVAFSHVAFNRDLYDFIRDNKLYSRPALNAMIEGSVARKPIADPPATSISLKFSWWPIAPDRMSPVPVWDFDPRYPGDAKNPPTSWKRVVMVDPIGGLPAPKSVTLGGFTHTNPSVVNLGSFYAVRLSAADAQLAMADGRLKRAANDVLNRELREGDLMLMTAMHIATREFEPWVFLTYWWTDKPKVGPLASDMPAKITGPWANFVMDVSYNINRPLTAEGKAPVAYSPWLELFQAGGTRSQCMACHARAAYGPGVRAAFNPPNMSSADPNGFEATPVGTDDPNFKPGTLSLRRIWTIFTRAK